MTDYAALGLKVGIEVHQELRTEHKLFCACPPKLFKEEPEYTFIRRLRPSQSELGEVDPAALFEFKQGKTMIYEANGETTCLVEMDEEPPGPLNDKALDICLTFTLMTGSKPIDEVHIMRKTVVDGSNTTGFQRTCIVSLGGSIEAGDKRYGLEQVCLEEDAARKMADEGLKSHYRIDRLGIPLIEVTTAPEIHSPEEAERVALTIGRTLRATGNVRRGLGTIRQDLNVSIKGGAVIEIKGVQELDLISKVIEYEAQRQKNLLEIASELKKRGVDPSGLTEEYIDFSEMFTSTKSPILQNALKKGQKILAVKLTGFGGLVGKELNPNRRLGTEMADRARFWGGVRGLFHTDELPAYGITREEVAKLSSKVNASESDAIVIIADEPEKCAKALSSVLERAKEAFNGVPSETRSADADGTTHFTRPRPGAARMYPETDVMAIPITKERMDRLQKDLPEMPEVKLKRIMREYKLNEKLARQIFESGSLDLFERTIKEAGVSPTLTAVTLTETLRSLKREGSNVDELSDEILIGVFHLVSEGSLAKESLPDVLRWLSKNPGAAPGDAIKALNLEQISEEELRRFIDNKVSENRELVVKLGEKSVGPLMGMVMGRFRGKVNPEEVQSNIKDAIRKVLISKIRQ